MKNLIVNKLFSTSITAVACLMIFSSMIIPASYADEESLDQIVAVVNDSVITQSDWDRELATAKKQIANSNMPTPPAKLLRKQVLDQMVNRKLQLQVAEQAGIHFTDAQVDKTISNIAEQNHVSVKELLHQVTLQGLDISDYRKELREEMMVQQVEQIEIGSHIVILPQEINDFMRSEAWRQFNGKEYHLQDILVALPDAPSPQELDTAKQRANNILEILNKGAKFDSIATENASKSDIQGGDLGWRQLPQIPSAFASQLMHMNENDIMGPLLTPNGYHIVKLVGIRGINNQESASAQRKKIEQLIFQRKMDEGIQNWIAKLRSTAFIKINTDKENK